MTDVKHHFFKVQMKLIYLYYHKLNGMLLKGLIKKETTIDKKELYFFEDVIHLYDKNNKSK